MYFRNARFFLIVASFLLHFSFSAYGYNGIEVEVRNEKDDTYIILSNIASDQFSLEVINEYKFRITPKMKTYYLAVGDTKPKGGGLIKELRVKYIGKEIGGKTAPLKYIEITLRKPGNVEVLERKIKTQKDKIITEVQLRIIRIIDKGDGEAREDGLPSLPEERDVSRSD